MKKLFSIFLSGLAIASTTLSFQSCADEYDPAIVTKHDQKQIEYNNAFVQTFGTPDPNHDWGFKPQPVINATATRSTNVEMNQWVSTYHLDVPGGLNSSAPWTNGDVTNDEREYVYWWFSTHKNPTPLTINWSDYFIQNVWGQPEHRGTYGMDQATPIFANGTHDEHISNFNSGGHATEQIEYQVNSTTNAFGYVSSYSTGDAHFVPNKYTLQYINGNYYLAFDYEHQKLDAQPVDIQRGDGYYNDWILKLWGGYHTVDEYTQRVMCEDLGGSFDFDFNDVVFDVTFIWDNGQQKADITLQAAGGTLPLYIGEVNDAYEVHNLFGVPTNTPVNVSSSGEIRPAVKFRLTLNESNYDSSFDEYGNKNAKGIKIFVGDGSGTAHEVCQFVEKGQHDGNNVPDKICCPSTTKWMMELQHISDGYPKFKSYVQDKTVTWYDQEGSNLYPYNGVGQDNARPYKPSIYADEHEGNIGFTEWSTLVANEVNWSSLSETLEQTEFESQCPSKHNYVADNTLGNNAKISVSVGTDGNGSVTINGESVTSKEFDKNDNVSLSANANTGYHFVKWVETYNTSVTVSTDANYNFSANSNVNLTAVFEQDSNNNGGNSDTSSVPSITGDFSGNGGENTEIQVAAAKFEGFISALGDNANNCTIKVTVTASNLNSGIYGGIRYNDNTGKQAGIYISSDSPSATAQLQNCNLKEGFNYLAIGFNNLPSDANISYTIRCE